MPLAAAQGLRERGFLRLWAAMRVQGVLLTGAARLGTAPVVDALMRMGSLQPSAVAMVGVGRVPLAAAMVWVGRVPLAAAWWLSPMRARGARRASLTATRGFIHLDMVRASMMCRAS